MMVIAAYDVSHDGRRSRLAAVLQTVGDRIQRSVFVLTLDQEELDEVSRRATAILDLDDDSLYLFRQCSSCWDVLQCIGQADPPTRLLYWAAL